MNEQFSSVFNKNEDHTNIPDKGPSPYPTMSPIVVKERGVKKLLNNLKPHKASGPDQIPTMLLKLLADEMSPILTEFFQVSIDRGEVPAEWRSANVIPIFKKGEKNKASNYRPVSLTCILCKTLEHILASNMMKHLDQYNIIKMQNSIKNLTSEHCMKILRFTLYFL